MSRYVLHSNNIDPDTDLKLVELAFPLQIQALTVGTVDGLIAIEPIGSMAIATGEIEPILTNVGATYVSNPFFGGTAVMTTKFVTERPEVAKRIMLVLRDITRRINADFDHFKPLLAKYSGVPETALPGVRPLLFRNEAEIDDTDLNALQKFTDVLSKEGVIAAPMDVRTKFIRLSDVK
jgi:NitT/TauT family transport system substrate-binding protein